MAKKRDYSLSPIIVCDDIRKEANGKEILIGTYGGEIIIFKKPPTKLRQLWLRIAFVTKRQHIEKFDLIIAGPNGKPVITGGGSMVVSSPNGAGSLAVRIPDFPLPAEGAFSVRFGMGERPRKIGQFFVRYQERQEAEEARGSE